MVTQKHSREMQNLILLDLGTITIIFFGVGAGVFVVFLMVIDLILGLEGFRVGTLLIGVKTYDT